MTERHNAVGTRRKLNVHKTFTRHVFFLAAVLPLKDFLYFGKYTSKSLLTDIFPFDCCCPNTQLVLPKFQCFSDIQNMCFQLKDLFYCIFLNKQRVTQTPMASFWCLYC